MKAKLFLAASVIILLASCQSKELKEAKSLIKQRDIQAAFNILIAEIHENPGNNQASKLLEKLYVENNIKTRDAQIIEEEINSKTSFVLFHGQGSEPYWDLYITDFEVLFVHLNVIKDPYLLLSTFDKEVNTQKIFFLGNDGIKRSVLITKEPTGDGMSDREYPYSIVFNNYSGYGDSKMMN